MENGMLFRNSKLQCVVYFKYQGVMVTDETVTEISAQFQVIVVCSPRRKRKVARTYRGRLNNINHIQDSHIRPVVT